MSAKRLRRSRSDRVIAGVCGGIGHYLDVDPVVVRILWVILSIFPGGIMGGIIVYVAAWFLMPEEGLEADADFEKEAPTEPADG